MIHRPFNSSYIKDGIFYKKSKSDRLADEIFYYQQINRFENNLMAKFIGDFSDAENYILGLKYYEDYHNAYELIKSDSINLGLCLNKIFKTLNNLHKLDKINIEIDNTEILINKTIKEFDKFFLQKELNNKNLFISDFLTINNKKYKNFLKLWPLIEKTIKDNFLKTKSTIIHGDYCFSNILINQTNLDIKLIDPRGSFHMRGCYGDPSYDYAKLFHSIFGNYESIIHNEFMIKIESETSFILEIKNILNKKNLSNIFSYFDEDKLFEYYLIQGLLFISMCSRHYTEYNHQIAMYLQGIIILNQIYEDKIEFLSSSVN